MKVIYFLICVLMCNLAYSQDTVVVDKINTANAKIKSFTADVETVIKRRAVAITLNGKLYCEKEKNIRLINTAVVGNKFMSDIGSNDSYFWFYAKRIDAKNLFYCKYANINKSNMKDSLNPLWLIESLNMIKVDAKNAKMQGDKLVLFQTKISPRNNKMIKAIVIDPKKPAIVGNYLYDSNKQIVTSANIKDFYTTNNGLLIPKLIEASWTEENVTMTWTFTNFKFNVPIDPKMFKIPDLQVNKVDLGNTKEKFNGIND
jgi:outer membrane lipoprotein-sorting protein